MSEYEPLQHQSKPQGYEHETIFANIELWADKLPDVIVLGDYRYRLERRMGPSEYIVLGDYRYRLQRENDEQ